jgi:hypothetical protein
VRVLLTVLPAFGVVMWWHGLGLVGCSAALAAFVITVLVFLNTHPKGILVEGPFAVAPLRSLLAFRVRVSELRMSIRGKLVRSVVNLSW